MRHVFSAFLWLLLLQGLIRFITVHGGAEQIPKLDSIVANAIAPESDVSKAFSSQDREDISKLFLEVSFHFLAYSDSFLLTVFAKKEC